MRFRRFSRVFASAREKPQNRTRILSIFPKDLSGAGHDLRATSIAKQWPTKKTINLTGGIMNRCKNNRKSLKRKLSLQPLQARCLMAGDFAIADGLVVKGMMDFGDAPNSYGTTAEVDGARHIVGGYRLGKTVDTEPNGQPSGSATRDGLDEDGVQFLGSAAAVVGRGVVDAWADTNGNGVFEDSEKFIDAEKLSSGLNLFLAPDAEYYRFRVSGEGGLDPTGFGGVGEVEDYRRDTWRIPPPPHDPVPPGNPGDPNDPDPGDPDPKDPAPIPNDPNPRDETEQPCDDSGKPCDEDDSSEDKDQDADRRPTSLDADRVDEALSIGLIWL